MTFAKFDALARRKHIDLYQGQIGLARLQATVLNMFATKGRSVTVEAIIGKPPFQESTEKKQTGEQMAAALKRQFMMLDPNIKITKRSKKPEVQH